VRPLRRKLARDLWRLRWQVLSIALVVASGIAAVVTFRSGLDSLDASRVAYYADARFADVFASLRRAPEPVARRLAEIPGVAAVQTRVVAGAVLDVPGFGETATGRIVSIPEGRGPAALNRLHLRAGRMPVPGRRGEALVGEAFADANGLAPGDTVGALVNGRWERLALVGVALSPEYVYATGEGAFLTDNRRFGLLWMDRDALAAARDLRGAFNDVALDLAPGAHEPAVLAAVDRILAPYGGSGAYGRADQPSDRIIRDEIRQNRATGTVIPVFILAVAAFLLNVVLGRLVGTERDQIAVLKAFGYTSGEVARHYLAFAMASVLLGVALGVAAGLRLGEGLVGLYAEHFRFPALRYAASWPLVAGAFALSAAAGAAGALGAVRRAARLPPAEAMRPEAPARFSHGAVERVLGGGLTPAGRIVLRNLTRRPLRTAAAVLGVGLSLSLVYVTLFFFAAFRYGFDLQFGHAQRQDLTVGFAETRGAGVRHALAHLPGVRRVETFRAVPARLVAGHRARRVALLGMEPGPALSRVLDRRGRPVAVPPTGLLLSGALADALGVRPGDTLDVEVREGARPTLRLVVRATADDLFGANAYVDLRVLARALGEAPSASGAHLAVDGGAAGAVHGRLKETPLVAGVTSPGAMLRNFEEHVAKNLTTNLLIVAVFAGVIALGVVYNGARISLAERARELASLRVLGFTVHEIAVILLGEQAVVVALGIPVGFAVGIAYAGVWVASLNGEVYRVPMVFTAAPFVQSAAIVAAMAAGAGLAVRRRLHRLDLVAVLKSRE
jgi:putative ABC transport system permease protein